MADNLDRRVTPARPDLAAAHLKGQVEAERFVEGETLQVQSGRTSLWSSADMPKSQDSELLFGELFVVYEKKRGWSWGQAVLDGYVGWINSDDLTAVFQAGDYAVAALATPLLTKPDLKTPLWDMLPLNARVTIQGRENGYASISPNLFVYEKHLVASDARGGDWVTVAERFLGAPYVWGGRTSSGLDCSGLIQTALQACGAGAPRDTDMMEKSLGHAVAQSDLKRGDLIFWKGHMGVMRDAATLLHANAFHMEVFSEPLSEAIARIAQTAGPVTSVKRL